MLASKKSIKKTFSSLLMLILVISFISVTCFKTNVYATEESTKTAKNLDVVLVMDKSSSMKKSDPQKTSIEAAKMFIDMLKKSGANVSIVEFSDTSESKGMVEVQDDASKKELKDTLSGIKFVGSATDTGDALLKAVDILKDNGNQENKKAIILFSDGKTAINRDGRTVEDSKKDIEKSIEKCNESNLSIYSVGLINGNDSQSDIAEFEKQMKNIANSTNGKYIRADNVNDLPKFFSELLQTLDGIKGEDLGSITANGDYQTVNFDITNSNVLEANIVVLHDKEVKDVKLINPDGKEVDLSSDDFVYTNSSKYTLIKMLKPEKGEWEMKVKGVSGDKINISLVYNYDLELVSSVSKNSAAKGDKVNINAYFNYENNKLEDKDFYGSIEAKAIIRDSKNKETEVKLNFQEDGYVGEVALEEYGDYYVTVHTSGQGIDKYSDEMKITCTNQAPVISNLDDKMDIKLGKNTNIDLNEYIKDPEGDKVTFNISNSDNDVISVKLDGSVLSITSNKEGKSDIEIVAKDSQDQASKFTISVNSYNPTAKIIKTVGIIAAIIIALIAIFMINEKSKRMKGQLRITINKSDSNSYENFVVDGTVNLSGYSKSFRSVLSNAVSQYSANNSQSNTEKLQNVIAMVNSRASKLEFRATGKKGDDRYKVKLIKKKDNSIALMDMSGIPNFNINSIIIEGTRFDYNCGVKFKLNNNDNEYVEIKMTFGKEQLY